MKKYTPIVTYIIGGICLVVFLLIHVLPFGNTDNAILLGCYYKPFVLAGEYWRLLTVGFTHVKSYHIFMNLVALYSLGRLLERMVGHWKFLLVLVFSIISGSLWIFILDGNTLVVGLSAGLYGLMALELYIFYLKGLLNNPMIKNEIIQMILINILINFVPGVSYTGHIGGFIGGLLMSMICIPLPSDKNHRVKTIFALCLYLLGMGYFIKQNAYISTNEQYKGTDVEMIVIYQNIGFDRYATHVMNRLDDIYGDTDISIAMQMKGALNYDTEKVY